MSANTIDETLAHAAAERRSVLSEIESKGILEAMGITTQMAELAHDAQEAARLAARCGFPVALKVLSPDVTHKSDVGGVALGLGSELEVSAAFHGIFASLSQRAPQARFEGVAVQAMAAPGGLELLAGITRDSQFGPMVMVGLGGVFVEVLRDTVVRVAPIDEREAVAMLAELRGSALLDGVRGRAGLDRGAMASLLARISRFAVGRPEIKEMDLNPVAVYPSGLSVLDARILLEHRTAGDERGASPGAEAALQARRRENLRRALNPRTVVVIGDRAARDFMWLRALDSFKGKRLSVQPDAKDAAEIEALGVKNVRSVSEIGEPIDYAIVAVPRKVAPQTLAESAAAGIAGIGFFTAGFSETGEQIGIELEAELKKIASRSDIALVGPNCMGLCNPGLGLLNSANLPSGEPGDVCFISQSGTHAISFCIQAPGHAIKVGMSASIGNALVLEAPDYLDVMASDPATRAVGIYLEGVRDGRRFFESLRRATARVPVLVWKGGVTDSGARATFSHTGSLATPAAVWRAVMRQSGAVEVAGLEPMLDAIELLTRARPVKGRGMALVAMTGGQSVAISDAFATHGLKVPDLSESSYAEFKSFFQVIGGSYRNPFDAAWTIGPTGGGQGNVDRVLDILDRDPVVDAIVMEFRPGPGFAGVRRPIDVRENIPLLDGLARFAQRARKPFAVAVESQHVPPEIRSAIVAEGSALARARGLATFDTFERAAGAFRAAAEYFERAQERVDIFVA